MKRNRQFAALLLSALLIMMQISSLSAVWAEMAPVEAQAAPAAEVAAH